MGTDIHMVGQQKQVWRHADNKTEWKCFEIPEPFQDRDYVFFAMLAGVRNGYGFAGCKIFEPLKPISEPKGLPVDYKPEMQKDEDDDDDAALYDKYLSGDHSQSWLSLKELKEYQVPVIRRCGYIEKSDWMRWDKVSRPEDWCGDIDGPKVIKVDSEAHPGLSAFFEFTHVKVYWWEPAVSMKKWQTLINLLELYKWQNEYDDESVRIVFDFDS